MHANPKLNAAHPQDFATGFLNAGAVQSSSECQMRGWREERLLSA